MPIPFTLTVKGRQGADAFAERPSTQVVRGNCQADPRNTADQVKRECKFYQGCPILMADDPQFVAFLSNLKNLTVEEKDSRDGLHLSHVCNDHQAAFRNVRCC